MNYTQCGSALALPYADGIAQTCVTSPPYYGLRDYGTAGQIGLEQTPAAYVAQIVAAMREVWRVLRDDGTLWLNLGDSYANNGLKDSSKVGGFTGERIRHLKAGIAYNTGIQDSRPRAIPDGLKAKDLMGIPWRVAFALQQPYTVPLCVKEETDKAWLAAMFEGEGTIGIRRFDSYREEKQQVYQDGFVVYTSVTNNDIPLLDRCVEITGKGSVRLKTAANSRDKRGILSRRDSYGWRLDGNAAVDVIRAIFPYLIVKRKQARIAYELDRLNKMGHGSKSVPAEIQERKRYLWELVKRCNQREEVDLPGWIGEPVQDVQPGWYLRSDIVWAKPNPMPESVTDRPTKAHEYVFLLAKQPRYFYDAEAIREENQGDGRKRGSRETMIKTTTGIPGGGKHNGFSDDKDYEHSGRNARSVWNIATQPFSGSHFATMPPELARRCILAGSSARGQCPKCGAPWTRVVEKGLTAHDGETDSAYEKGTTANRLAKLRQAARERGEEYTNGKVTTGWAASCDCDAGDPVPQIVLDPFAGSGTTAMVALQNGRRAIGVELNPAYMKLQNERTMVTMGLGL